MVPLVNSMGTWTHAKSRTKDKIENPGLVLQEQIKNRKHADFYAPIGFAFFPFVVSYFGSFGPTAVRCVFSLADFELRQHDSQLAKQHLPPMLDPSARPQCRAICYRQISARIRQAVAKATVMRLLGVPPSGILTPCRSSIYHAYRCIYMLEVMHVLIYHAYSRIVCVCIYIQ